LARFAVVGGATAVVQLGMLVALKSVGVGSVGAYALGLIVSCQFNFVLNILLVWQDRPVSGHPVRALAKRWTAYHSCTAVAVGLNFGIFALAQLWLPDLAAGVVAIAGSTLVKFFSLDRLAFKAEAEPGF
jgi:putative flippase GtrA